jgi:hypothetical protein
MKRPHGADAARLRQRKYELLRLLQIPREAIAGSLSVHYRGCGHAGCHCTKGQGHAQWKLTFMVDGKKRVETIPADWVESVRPRVDEARRFKQEISELFAANAQLVVLTRKQRAK